MPTLGRCTAHHSVASYETLPACRSSRPWVCSILHLFLHLPLPPSCLICSFPSFLSFSKTSPLSFPSTVQSQALGFIFSSGNFFLSCIFDTFRLMVLSSWGRGIPRPGKRREIPPSGIGTPGRCTTRQGRVEWSRGLPLPLGGLNPTAYQLGKNASKSGTKTGVSAGTWAGASEECSVTALRKQLSQLIVSEPTCVRTLCSG